MMHPRETQHVLLQVHVLWVLPCVFVKFKSIEVCACILRFRSDVKLEPSDRITYGKPVDKVYTLTIDKVKNDEAGMYTVKATNEQGQMSASARLRVTRMYLETYSVIRQSVHEVELWAIVSIGLHIWA